MEIQYKHEVLKFLNIPDVPKKKWNGKDSFKDGVAVLSLRYGQKAYAICTFDNSKDDAPRVKKVFSVEAFSSIDDIYVVPSYMDNDMSDSDLDAESKKKAEQIVSEAKVLEDEGVSNASLDEAKALPEWIFENIHNKEEAIAYLREWNRINKIKKGKIPTDEESIKIRLYAIFRDGKKK